MSNSILQYEVLGADARLTFLHRVDVDALQEGLCAETVASAQTPAWRPNLIFSCSFCHAGCAWRDSSDMRLIVPTRREPSMDVVDLSGEIDIKIPKSISFSIPATNIKFTGFR
jgi:hypothetical protein